MSSKHDAVNYALKLVEQSRKLRERSLLRRQELQAKTDRMNATSPYVVKKNKEQQMELKII